MKFNEIVQTFGDRAWFDFEMVHLISGEASACVHTELYRWRESGKLIELRRGLFALAEPWRHSLIDGACLAEALYPPSYLSGSWALRRYGLLPVDASADAESEGRAFDSVTARPAKTFKNTFGCYTYTTFPRDLLFGTRTELIGGKRVRMALLEKALLDYWFIEGGEWDKGRIENAGLSRGALDSERLEAFTVRAGRPRLARTTEAFLRAAL
ncbi:MAG: hypothetical protein CVV53_00355 [Spirochaetae bacterium HGW-Spirochaetae-9]|nr:MAG: hypothetical protein CVV53_00355 [Spirochaetae bacterium HGW-Spirochaetae-9]